MPNIMPPAALPVLPSVPGEPQGATRQEKLRHACQDFESLFIYKLLEQMRATVPHTGYLHGAQEDIYNTICDQQVAISLAKSGGIGLAKMLYRQLSGPKGAQAEPDKAAAPAQVPPRSELPASEPTTIGRGSRWSLQRSIRR